MVQPLWCTNFDKVLALLHISRYEQPRSFPQIFGVAVEGCLLMLSCAPSSQWQQRISPKLISADMDTQWSSGSRGS